MNKYNVQHVEKMLIPLLDKINILENKMNDAEIYTIQELIKNNPIIQQIKELSDKLREIEHDFNNIRAAICGNTDLIKMVIEDSKKEK